MHLNLESNSTITIHHHTSQASYPLSCVPGSKLPMLGMVIPPFNRNPYNGYINPYYWVDDHPLLYWNNGSLDPGTCMIRHLLLKTHPVLWNSGLSQTQVTARKTQPQRLSPHLFFFGLVLRDWDNALILGGYELSTSYQLSSRFKI